MRWYRRVFWNSIYVCAILFYTSAAFGNETGNNGVGVVRNLTVKLTKDKDSLDHDEKHRSLRLNVSWLPPDKGRQPTSYSVLVTNANRNDEYNASVCPEGSLYYVSKDPQELSVLFPQNERPTDMSEMHFYPSCSYRVQVFANPRMKATLKAEVVFTVPDCIDELCSCSDASVKLPTPNVQAIVHKDDVKISWNVTSNFSSIDSYVISIGVPILISKSGNPVYNVTRIGIVTANNTVYAWNAKNDGAHDRLHNGEKIFVAAIDKQGCIGPDGMYIIRLEEEFGFLESKGIWLMLIGGVCGCTFFGILKLTYIYKKKYELLWPSEPFTRMHASIPKCRSNWTESILLKHNVLYVEPNIRESCKEGVDEYEIPYKNVKLIRSLGAGQFGKVYLGCLEECEQKLVAVKVSQNVNLHADYEERQQLLEEINIMKMAGTHPHLVQLIGYSTSPQRPVCIILEYMQGGDLLAYLHRRKENKQKQDPYGSVASQLLSETNYSTLCNSRTEHAAKCTFDVNTKKIEKKQENGKPSKEFLSFGSIDRNLFVKFALDIAKGMEHLEAKNITHRDLAARNILLSSDLTLKISDFGLSRNGIYVMSNAKRRLPIRWMSPEALRERAFTPKGDVWSFAIVLWEIATLGAFPYPNIEDDQLLRYVIYEQGHPAKPDWVCNDLYELMRSCWTQIPEERPTFAQLVLDLQVLKEPTHSSCEMSNPCYTVLTHMKNKQ